MLLLKAEAVTKDSKVKYELLNRRRFWRHGRDYRARVHAVSLQRLAAPTIRLLSADGRVI